MVAIASQRAGTLAGGFGSLFSKCVRFDIRTALTQPGSTPDLVLGPFAETVDQTACPFCQIARQVVSYQEKNPEQTLEISSNSMGRLLVEKVKAGDSFGGAHLSSSADDSNYIGLAEKSSEAVARIEANVQSPANVTAPPAGYSTYSMEDACNYTLQWLETCSNKHDTTCRSNQKRHSMPSNAFFVDVQSWNIVDSASCTSKDYFALSYVCGGHAGLQLTGQNRPVLAAPNALRSQNLPQTYIDAIEFTNKCGVRYLWIDFLCVMHDDQGNSDSQQIDAMDQVYGQATLVLIAGLGSSPDFGLLPKAIHRQQVQGIWLYMHRNVVKSDSYLDEIRSAKYVTRCWCFQEQFLSTRRLYFGAHWLRFQCDNINIMVSTNDFGQAFVQQVSDVPDPVLNDETSSLQTMTLAGSNPGGVSASELFRCYALVVEGYTERELGWPADIGRAFAGIASILGRVPNNQVIQGIPTRLLPHALLWTTRTTNTVVERLPGAGLLTYSWMSCATVVTYAPLHDRLIAQPNGGTDKAVPLVRSFNVGAALQFDAEVVSAQSFRLNYLHNNRSTPVIRYRQGSHAVCGLAMSLANGHEQCFEASSTSTGPYLILPLVCISESDWSLVGLQLHGLEVSNVLIGLIVFQQSSWQIRTGLVYITEQAFRSASPYRAAISLQ